MVDVGSVQLKEFVNLAPQAPREKEVAYTQGKAPAQRVKAQPLSSVYILPVEGVSVSFSVRQGSEAAKVLQDKIAMLTKDIEVRVDRDANMVVVKVMDQSSGEMIRQIPVQEVVDLAARMNEIVGLIFDKRG